MVKKFYIYLFRHGLTSYNRDRKFTGWKDIPLAKQGFSDAKMIAFRLKDKKFKIAIHTSLKRSKQTLREVLKFHPECKKIIEDDRIKERNYGKLNSYSHLEIAKKYGFDSYDKWHRDFNSRPPGGESFKDVEKRVASFIKSLKELISKEKSNVAISAHGNSIRLFRKIWEGLSEKESEELEIPYDKIYSYEIKV
ncbi:MAG: phosphoglycerate mutase family protein [Candidatus Pacearchaeota archaeon]